MDFRELVGRIRDLNAFSRAAFRTGAVAMAAFYIVAVAARIAAPSSEGYFELMAVYRGCLEAAPTCMAVGVAIALIGDLVLHRSEK